MFADPVFYALYIVAALFVGFLGLERRIGVLGFFILAILLSPPIVLLILIVTRPKSLRQKHRRFESD